MQLGAAWCQSGSGARSVFGQPSQFEAGPAGPSPVAPGSTSAPKASSTTTAGTASPGVAAGAGASTGVRAITTPLPLPSSPSITLGVDSVRLASAASQAGRRFCADCSS